MSRARVLGWDPKASPPDAFAVDARTRAFYEENAEAYATATRGADLSTLWKRFEHWLAPGARLADLGCGSGRDMRRFAAAGLVPIGLDRSLALCRIAATFSSCPVVAGDTRALPFHDRAFDGVWAAAVLLHLPAAELTLALTDIVRVLQPGGIAMLSFKEGQGAGRDEQGRFTQYYEESALHSVFSRAGLQAFDTVRTREVRDRSVVSWLAFFLRSTEEHRAE